MKPILIAILIFNIISFFLSFLALNDIYHEYLNKDMLISKDIVKDINGIPEWANCKLEWNIIKIDIFIRFIFTFLITIFILKFIKAIK